MRFARYGLALAFVAVSPAAGAQDLLAGVRQMDDNLSEMRMAISSSPGLEDAARDALSDEVRGLRRCNNRIRNVVAPRLIADERSALGHVIDAQAAVVFEVSRTVASQPEAAQARLADVRSDLAEICSTNTSAGTGASPVISLRRSVKVTTVDSNAQPISGFYVTATPPRLPGERFVETFGQVTNPTSEHRLLVGRWIFAARKGERNFTHTATLRRGGTDPFEVSIVVTP